MVDGGSPRNMTAPFIEMADRSQSPESEYLVHDDDADEDGAEDEVLHVRIAELPHKSLRQEIRALRDMERWLMSHISMNPDVRSIKHRDIVNELLYVVWNSNGISGATQQEAVDTIFSGVRDDGTEVWQEMIEGRSFVVVLGNIPGLTENFMSLGKLYQPLQLSSAGSGLVKYVAVVIGPPAINAHMATRTVLENGRSIAAVLSDVQFRMDAETATTPEQFKAALHTFLGMKRASREIPQASGHQPWCTRPFSGLVENVTRRLRWYASDFTEAWEYKSKVISTAIYLFCVIIAPAIAFGELMAEKTDGLIGPMEILISQSISGLIFSLFGGCPFVIIMTTGPLTVFIGFLHDLSDSLDVPFLTFYAWVGMWNSLFLMMSVAFNLSNQIHYVTAFVDQIFGALVAGIFIFEAVEPLGKHFFTPEEGHEAAGCMGVVLAVGTFLVAAALMDLRASQRFNKMLRNIASDYGTAIAVIVMTIIYQLAEVDHVMTLEVPDFIELSDPNRTIVVDITNIDTYAAFVAAGPASLLFMLFFMDENITSILSNKKEYKLRKGEAMHLDLFVVAIINVMLGLCGLPFLHGALPQSPLHVLQLADEEEYVEQGVVVKRVVRSRETRMTSLLCHVLFIVATLAALPVLKLLPVPVLHGVFLTMAYQGLSGNPFVDRVLLWFTELSNYPPTHLVRRLELRTIHKWTFTQLVCFAILWAVKSSPAALGFPFVIVLLVIVRHKLLPSFFKDYDIHILESH